jgi:hypothetical protein
MELPIEPFNQALEHLNIRICHKLEYLPEKLWGGLQSLQSMVINHYRILKCMSDGIWIAKH